MRRCKSCFTKFKCFLFDKLLYIWVERTGKMGKLISNDGFPKYFDHIR